MDVVGIKNPRFEGGDWWRKKLAKTGELNPNFYFLQHLHSAMHL